MYSETQFLSGILSMFLCNNNFIGLITCQSSRSIYTPNVVYIDRGRFVESILCILKQTIQNKRGIQVTRAPIVFAGQTNTIDNEWITANRICKCLFCALIDESTTKFFSAKAIAKWDIRLKYKKETSTINQIRPIAFVMFFHCKEVCYRLNGMNMHLSGIRFIYWIILDGKIKFIGKTAQQLPIPICVCLLGIYSGLTDSMFTW